MVSVCQQIFLKFVRFRFSKKHLEKYVSAIFVFDLRAEVRLCYLEFPCAYMLVLYNVPNRYESQCAELAARR